jgi:hypothetical protein
MGLPLGMADTVHRPVLFAITCASLTSLNSTAVRSLLECASATLSFGVPF